MMRFAYLALRVSRAVATLRSGNTRYLPIFAVTVEGPQGDRLIDCRLDSGSDDTIFPLQIARAIGINLANAPVGQARGVGGPGITCRYAPVGLRVTDGKEECTWQAIVGFVDLPITRGLLGLTGFLEYIEATLSGSRQEVLLTPATTFPGQHIVRP